MRVAIIKYNAGNTQSLQFALERIGAEPVITNDLHLIKEADKVIFPGVGEASTAMLCLRQKGIDKLIKNLNQPVLGICLGMQLLCASSEEGNTDCLGIFNIQVKRFPNLKVPHTGWNQIEPRSQTLFKNIPGNAYCYFVHSYYSDITNDTSAITDYGISFSSALQKDNFYGVQFHPEKSAAIGEQILKNFLSL